MTVTIKFTREHQLALCAAVADAEDRERSVRDIACDLFVYGMDHRLERYDGPDGRIAEVVRDRAAIAELRDLAYGISS